MRAARQVAILDKNGDHLRYIARGEAQKMVGTGEATHFCRHCGSDDEKKKQCQGRVQMHSMVFMATPLYRNIHVSPCSLTFREMLANVGAAGSQAYQRAVRVKIEHWDDPAAVRREITVCAS
jgi:hypothetical protein